VINPNDLDEETPRQIPKDGTVAQFIEEQEKILYFEDLKNELNSSGTGEDYRQIIKGLIKEMERLEAQIIVPVIHYDSRLKYVLTLICLGRWHQKGRGETVNEKDRQLLEKLSLYAGTAFVHSLKKRLEEITKIKKEELLKDTMGEMRKMDLEKASVEEAFKQMRKRASRFMDMSSKFATKIQVLNENQEDYETIMRHTQSGVLTIRNGLIKAANKQAKYYLGESGQEIEGKTFEEVFINQFKNTPQIVSDIKKVIGTGEISHTFETEWVKEQPGLPVEVKIIPLRDRFKIGQVNGAMVEIVNISEAKEREFRAKIKDFTAMLEGLRHELNNAMNIFNLYSSVIKSSNEEILSKPEFRKDFCAAIPETVKFVSGLIDDLAEAHSPLKLEDTTSLDFNEAAEEVLKEFAGRLKDSNIRVEKNFGAPSKITAVPKHLRVLFYQIIKNSVEAIEEYDRQRELGRVEKTGGKIFIATRVNEAGELEAEIGDDGVGIDEVSLNKVLNPFFTTKIHSTTHSETGTGLGLNKVSNVVSLYQGSFKISSKVGEGTKVVVSLKPDVVKKKEAENGPNNPA
jgi:PAS domain S-box-containing protein